MTEPREALQSDRDRAEHEARRQAIVSMEAGPALDRAVHTVLGHVDPFGWEQQRWCDLEDTGPGLGGLRELYVCRRCGSRTEASGIVTHIGPCCPGVPPYSTDPGAAFLIVAHLNAQGLFFELFMQNDGDSAARFFRERSRSDMPWHGYWQTRNKMPIAVCRAALLATLEAAP